MSLNEIFMNPTVIWFLVGLVLVLLEIVIPGFVLFFFGLGAWITSLSLVLFEPSINIQLVIFFISSIVLLVLLRRQLKSSFFKERDGKDEFEAEEFIGRTAEVLADIPLNKSGQVEFNGTIWTAKSRVALKAGELVEIEKKESICLIVKPKK